MKLIDNEDYEKVLVGLTLDSAVADRLRVDREDFDYVADQLLGGETLDRKEKIDINDLSTVIQEVEAAMA